MFFSGSLPLAILALSPIAFAAPAPTPDTIQVASAVEAIDWIPVDFEGKTLYVNSAAVVDTSLNPAKKVVRVLRRSTTDRCGGSTFDPLSAPPAYVSDCRVIQDFAYNANSFWGVWDNTPDTHGLWYYGSCVFEAGTYNNVETYIGSTDVGDLTRISIDLFQYTPNLIGAQGQMRCESTDIYAASLTNWKLTHS